MCTPTQRSARLQPPARIADRPARGVPGSEFVPPRASASGSCSPSAASAESFSKLSGSSGLGRGLPGPTSTSGSAEEREESNLSRKWPGHLGKALENAPCFLRPESQDSWKAPGRASLGHSCACSTASSAPTLTQEPPSLHEDTLTGPISAPHLHKHTPPWTSLYTQRHTPTDQMINSLLTLASGTLAGA